MTKVLLIEDDEACAYALQGGLDLIGTYEIEVANNGMDGLKLFETFAPDVVVTDIEMPRMNGYEMVEKIREKDKSVIIIMESGKTMPKDVVAGYDLGVDDYIKKPFVAEELHAHIQAILKRTEHFFRNIASQNPNCIYIGNYKLDNGENTLELRTEKQKLTAREARILKMLYENRNKLVERNTILTSFWKDKSSFSSRSLDVFISKLRKYLAQDTSIKIVTIKGKGIKLDVSSEISTK